MEGAFPIQTLPLPVLFVSQECRTQEFCQVVCTLIAKPVLTRTLAEPRRFPVQLHPAPSSSHKQLTRCLPTATSPPSPRSTWPKPPTPSRSPPAAHNIGSQHLPSCVAPLPVMDPGSCRRPHMRVWHRTGEAAWSTEGRWSNSRPLPGIPSTMAYQAVTPGNP